MGRQVAQRSSQASTSWSAAPLVRIAKVDVDSNQATAMRYGVRSIPTLLLFKDGAVQAQQVGMTSKDNLKKILDAKL